MTSIGLSPGAEAAKVADRLRPVRIWLYCVALMIMATLVLGGFTRATGSGLSITAWQPISGVIPPLNAAQWQAEFDNYKKIPQYLVNNPDMTLGGFQAIFWPEFLHRLLDRLIGLAFLVPFLVFLVQRRLTRKLVGPLALLFCLGGLEGAIGWWMVTSGIETSTLTSVSQYRLAIHLCTALILFLAMLWVARTLEPGAPDPVARRTKRWPIAVLLVLIFCQIAMGAFVAGLHAGMGYNTWPLMDGAAIPDGLGAMTPLWRNFFENAETVQFIHRNIAYLIVIYAAVLIWLQARAGGFDGVNGWLPRLGVLILLQVILGISTLLAYVPLPLALGHQVLAFMLAGATVAYLADLTRLHGSKLPHPRY
jgi:cytochrome c oxidase assembly protein subunit 15